MKDFECDINANNFDWLYNEYVINKKSLRQIAKDCNVSDDTIRTRLNRFNIPIRNHSEANAISGEKYNRKPATAEETKIRYDKIRNGEIIQCLNCGSEIYVTPCKILFRKFCNIDCRNEYWRNHIDRNQDWRDFPEYDVWRKEIYERDNWKCKICGSKEHINAHHIFAGADLPDLRFQIDNGITLCEFHHIQLHKNQSSFIKELIKQTPNFGENLEIDNPEALIREILFSLIRSND